MPPKEVKKVENVEVKKIEANHKMNNKVYMSPPGKNSPPVK